MRLQLPHGETDERKRYSFPDPDALGGLYESAYRAAWYEKRPLERDEVLALLSMASGYLDLTTYELGQECCVEKLRDIWRARRASATGGTDGG